MGLRGVKEKCILVFQSHFGLISTVVAEIFVDAIAGDFQSHFGLISTGA